MKDETAMVKIMHSQLNYSLTHHGGLYYIKTNPDFLCKSMDWFKYDRGHYQVMKSSNQFRRK